MGEVLNLLVIEDSEADFLLIERHLRRSELGVRCHRVASIEALSTALDAGGWDIILSDYSIPHLNFLESFNLVRTRLPDVPVILVSGSIGEERAVELLKLGICDFVLKDSLVRLVTAIERSMEEAGERRARRTAEEDRTRVEAQLRQAQKMEALGTLAGGIAHDFNNILGIIVGYTEMARWDAGEDSAAKSHLMEVLKAAERAKDLVQQILAFSRRSEQERRPIQVGLIVKEAMKMLRASLPSTINIKVNVASRAIVSADPTQIHQVLMNLCTNAAHAMSDNGGVLEVALTDVRVGPESIMPHSDVRPGPFVKLTVEDTGCGMDPAILDRIFDPFFTTKEPGVGTGLGLSVVHGIVKSHGGAIEVESSPGRGTTFQVLLPTMECTPGLETEAAGPLPRGRERILVVDDEPALAMAAKQMLERLGYRVDYRTSGIEALDTFRLQLTEGPFDLVITDMTMPDLTGTDLARELLALQPALPILLCTGFSEKMNAEKAKSLGIQGFLMKPVIMSELARMIREVLDTKMK